MILTNNILIKDNHINQWVDGDQGDVLYSARDLVHKGHKLITSPLAASGRMYYSPVRTIVLTDDSGDIDLDSVNAVESAIIKYTTALGKHTVDYRNLVDYQIIDNELLTEALKEIERLGIKL